MTLILYGLWAFAYVAWGAAMAWAVVDMRRPMS